MWTGNGGTGTTPDIHESRPPAWLPKTHASADLGYPGFHPPRPGRSEDALSEVSAKNGHSIPAETFSAQDTIHNRFVDSAALPELEDIINRVFARRAEQVAPISPFSFRMPSRVTLNDAKRHTWFADLANPDVPLHKLGKSVPHGAKGHDLLDLLHVNKVAIPRAVWFLRVFGANETAGLRNKPSYNPNQYSVDWTVVVTSYMKKQLADIALPSAPRAGLNIKQTFKGVLADADSRNRWISRFSYCLQLLHTFYVEGLVDSITFLTWLVQQMCTCNLAQAGFVSRLADTYLDGMLGCRGLTRPFTEACLSKLSEIRTTPAGESLVDTEILLKTILQRICLALPDAFINPRTWMVHSGLLQQVLAEDIFRNSTGSAEEVARDIHHTLLDQLSDIKRRNEAMLFHNFPTRGTARLGGAVSDIQLLNSISSTTDLDTLSFFEQVTDYSPEFIEKLENLLTWSVTSTQYGDHRPYAAVTLLRSWRDKAVERATEHDCIPVDFIQDQLFIWLDSSDVASESQNSRTIALLLGEMVKTELFLYANYIQRLVARGETGLSFNEEGASRHRTFLSWIPLYSSTPSLANQRKVTMYGTRARSTPEESNERKIRKEIRSTIPELFGGETRPTFSSASALLAECPALQEASRYEQVRTFRQWLLPILRKFFTDQAVDDSSQLIVAKLYSISIEIMAHSKCFDFVLELSLFMLEQSTTTHALGIIIATFRRYLIIWTCMGAAGTIATALYAAHQFWKTRGLQSRDLLSLLLDVDNGRCLDAAARDQVAADISAFRNALHPQTDNPDPVPARLPEILLLVDDPNPEAPSILANSLWYKYRTSFDWAWKVWDSTVASLRQIPVMMTDLAERQACALRYGNFLLHVDEHLPAGCDDQVLQWFLGPGQNEVVLLNSDAWDVLTIVLLYLSVNGAIKTTTILRGLVYPAWQRTATASAQGEFPEVYLCAANSLFELLLLREHGIAEGIPPSDLIDFQRVHTWRQDVYREPDFSLLVASIPTLIFIEKNENVSDDLRQISTKLRRSLCEVSEFRQATHRNLDKVREAIEQPLQSGVHDDICKSFIDALQLTLCESDNNLPNDWQDLSSLLSPCNLGATAVVMQFVLRQMGRRLSQELSHQAASDSLDEMTLKIFHHSMTPEEAYSVAEMVKGVDNAVAGKFINNGLRCITETINSCAITEPSENLAACVRRSGEVLRVLTLIAEPLRTEASLLPPLETRIQEEFFEAISNKLKDIESLLVSGEGDSSKWGRSEIAHTTIFLSRLLQFDLGFRGAWTPVTKSGSTCLSSTIVHLAMLYGSGNNVDPITFPLLLDTLYYLIDEIPPDPKTSNFDPFCNYPKRQVSEVPTDMPAEYRKQLQSLLPHVPPNAYVANLVTASRDENGTLVLGGPVLNRPWEWMENLGEPPTLDPKDEEIEREEKERLKTRYLVKNAASISLEAFAAQPTGDGVIPTYDDPRVEGNIRSFEDGLSSESIFKRDWRESRVTFEGTATIQTRARLEDDEGSGATSTTSQLKQDKRPTPRASPAGSARSRTSAQVSNSGSVTSLRQSPAQQQPNRPSSPTAGDQVDMKTGTATAGASMLESTTKRKAADISDDEIEIVDGPSPVKKAKTKSMRARGKKR